MNLNSRRILVIFTLFSLKLLAYPDFISYGYKSCLTCHYNGQGSGPLNDYGRALFASEFTATTFTDKKPDQLADESGFLGSIEMPYWLRMGLKYRGLHFQSDVGSPKPKDEWINMQGDLDVILSLDQKNKYIFVINGGYIPVPRKIKNSIEEKPSEWISKQHYIRWQIQKGWMFYAGLMDKVFGIRHADHTAFSRSVIGLGQTDQSHGVTLQYSGETFDISAMGFMGNLNQEKDLRQVGGSMMAEYYIDKMLTLGGSVLSSKNDFKNENRVALHSRVGFAKGKSFMLEVGLLDNSSNTTADVKNKGYYTFLEGLIGLSKGYNFFTTHQTYKKDLSSTASLEVSRLSLGFLIFPWSRTEFRTEIVNTRAVAEQNTSPDQWTLQNQVHISW